MGAIDRAFNRGADAIQGAITQALRAEGFTRCYCTKSVERSGSGVPKAIEFHLRGNGRRVIATFTRGEVLEAATRVDSVFGRVKIIVARIWNSSNAG